MDNSKQETRTLKIGLTSFGLSGQVFHAPFIELNPNFTLTHVVERSKRLSERLYSKPIILESYAELLDSDVDVIIINTPTYLHYSMAKDALDKGKHIVIEKPLTVKLKEAEKLITLAHSKELTLAVYHNRRLESGFKTLKHIIDKNILGTPTYFKSHFNRNKPIIGTKKWKEDPLFEGAGIFYDLAPHLIDQAITLFGYPDKINSVFERQRPNTKVDDYFLLTFNYTNGLKVELEAGMYVKRQEPNYLLRSENGMYHKEKEDHQEWLLRQGIFPSKKDPDTGIITFSTGEQKRLPNQEGSYGDFYNNLYQNIVYQEPLLIPTNEALNVVRIMDYCINKNV